MVSSLYKGKHNQGAGKKGIDYDAFRQAIQDADDEFFSRMQEEARQRGIREEDIQQGMQMIHQMRGGGIRRNFRIDKGGSKNYG